MVKKNYDDMLSRFHLIPKRHGQTDGRTDMHNCYISIACHPIFMKFCTQQQILNWMNVT